MIPAYSSSQVVAGFLTRIADPNFPLVDYETGGADLNVASQDTSYEWKAEWLDGTVYLSREGVSPVGVLNIAAPTHIALAFDAVMRPHIAYDMSGASHLWYWDTLANAYATLDFPGAKSIRLTSDEKRPYFSDLRDIVCAYIRGTTLYSRVQRERFAVEHEGPTGLNPAAKIVGVAMGRNQRVHWRITP